MRKRGLRKREKRPHFFTAWADDPNRASDNQQQKILGAGKGQARSRHENGSDNKHAPPADPIRSSREQEGNNNIAEERQGAKYARLGFAQPHGGYEKNQNHGYPPISDQNKESVKQPK